MHLLLLLACPAPVSPELGEPTDADTDADADTDTDADADADADADTDTDPLTDAEVFGAVSVTVHPEVATVLEVDWTQLLDVDAAWLSWELDGVAYTSPARALAPGDAHEVVLGVPSETALTLTLHARLGDQSTERVLPTTSTGALPALLGSPTLTVPATTAARPEPWLLTSVNVGPYDFYGPCFVVILDQAARVVWYAPVSGSRLTMFPKVSRRGGYLTWDATSYYAGGTPSITRARLDRTQLEEVEVRGMGLAYDELDDGAFLFDENEDGYRYHLTRQDPDGTRTRLWDCYPWMSAWYTDYWGCAANTVSWDPKRGTVLWSMFQTSTVVELDPATGTLLREFGSYPGGYGFDPVDAGFLLQHYPNWTADGTLIVSTHVVGAPGVQVAREFEVDDAGEALHEVWSYTPAAGWYAEYAGQVQKLPTGNVLWQFGTEGVVQEATADGEVAWEMSWDGHLLGNVTPIGDLYALNEGW